MPVRHFLRNDYLHILMDIKFLVSVCLALQLLYHTGMMFF